jgi:ABC-type anion transport system duplicated permease subunit
MAEQSNIKRELIKQMDKNSDKLSGVNIRSPQEIIVRDTKRVKRLKWITVFSWLLVVICFILAAFLYWAEASNAIIDIERAWLRSLATIIRVMFVIAILFTISLCISLFIRSRSLTIHQIQVRLANIEELLKKMSQDK